MESPCIKVCVINRDTGLCEGCARSIPEITAWTSMTDRDRRRVMDELPRRKPNAAAATSES